jgi:hypothetical protein
MAGRLDPVTDIHVRVGEIQVVGETALGLRRIIPILGGHCAGPLLSAEVLPGGADWQLIRRDGVAEIEARYALRTADGALVSVLNRGLRHGPADVMARLAAGEAVDPSLYYFRTAPRFETASERHAWLTRTIFVGVGRRDPDLVHIEVFALR